VRCGHNQTQCDQYNKTFHRFPRTRLTYSFSVNATFYIETAELHLSINV
jgi:hypothetical protein